MDWLVIAFRLLHILSAITWVGGTALFFFYIEPTIGIGLYYHDAGGLQLWTSPTGTVFTIGAIAGILGWLGGGVLVAPAVKKVAAIGAEMKSAGGPPSGELMGRMHAAQERLRMIGTWDLVLVVIAAVCMSTARYFV